MRQVPRYLLIGGGRTARHMRHYFSLLGLSYATWQRSESLSQLEQHSKHVSHILLLISDHAIDEFISQHLADTDAICMHFSGSLVSNKAYGAHPLMSFSADLYDLEQYQRIPFIVDHDAPVFEDLLPGLSNQHVRLQTSLKAKYHALCVLSGNFSCMLWQKLFSDFETEFNLPATIAHPYLVQQTKNLLNNPKLALTGPLVRNDQETIEKNLTALHTDAFQDIYKSFVSCYQQLKEEGAR